MNELEGSIEAEYLIDNKGNAFAFTGNAEEDLLSITSVHPMIEEGARELLGKAQEGREVVQRLVDDGRLIEVDHKGNRCYMRQLVGPKRNGSLDQT